MKVYDVLCGNTGCAARAEGRMFRVASLETGDASEHAALVRPGATSDEDLIDGVDGVMEDGEVWLCRECR